MMEWNETIERLESVAEALELAAQSLAEQQVALAAGAQQSVERIVATVATARETELERRLAETEARLVEAEGKLAALSAAGAPVTQSGGRTTLPAGVVTMLAKQGVSVDATGALPQEPAALDGALASLSIEQRIAVKAELMRAGLIG